MDIPLPITQIMDGPLITQLATAFSPGDAWCTPIGQRAEGVNKARLYSLDVKQGLVVHRLSLVTLSDMTRTVALRRRPTTRISRVNFSMVKTGVALLTPRVANSC